MVVTNAMSAVLASKRARERDEMYAMQELGNAMAAAAGNIAQAEMAEKDRRQQLLMYEEEKQYERDMADEEKQYRREQDRVNDFYKRKSDNMNFMFKAAQAGALPPMEDFLAQGGTRAEYGVMQKAAEIAEQERTYKREEASRKESESKARVAESTARTGAYKSESVKDFSEAGKNALEAVLSFLRGGKRDTTMERTIYTRKKMEELAQMRRKWTEADNAADRQDFARKWYRGYLADLSEKGMTLEDVEDPIMLKEVARAAFEAGNRRLAERIKAIAMKR